MHMNEYMNEQTNNLHFNTILFYQTQV
jgi:hypothetical protein